MKKYVVIGNAESVHLVKWVRELIKYFDVYIISSKKTNDAIHSMVADTKIFDLDLKISERGGNWRLLQKYSSVKKIIRDIDPDFVNAHYITSHGFLAALISKFSRFRFTLIQSAWGSDILISPFRNKLYNFITRYSLDAGDLITSDSMHMTGVIATLSASPVTTFAFGIDRLPDIAPENKTENLYFSNRILTENYNIGEVIRFFSKIAAADPAARLIISNDGSMRKELEQLVKNLGLENNITFKGFVSLEEQSSYYEKSQFFISIPESDATSVSLLEAMAYGCIPIVSDIPANHEWIRDKVNGIYYSEETGIPVLEEALKMKRTIFDTNRSIIQERAIFPDSIKKYVNEIMELKGGSKH